MQNCQSQKTTCSGQEMSIKDFEEKTRVCRRKQEKRFRKKGREEERTSKEKLERKKGRREEGASWKHNVVCDNLSTLSLVLRKRIQEKNK